MPCIKCKYKIVLSGVYILGWPKSLFSFFHKMKDTFFISPITLLIWVFWVCQLSPTWYNADCSQLMSSFDHYQPQMVYPTYRGTSFGKKCPAWNLTNHFWHIQSVRTLSPYTAQIFLCVCVSVVFTFLEIIKHNMPKCCVFLSIFTIKMATQKLTNLDVFFKCMLIWQLSQYNLTKLFHMKLKTTKHY